MDLPTFSLKHRLSQWLGCSVEMRCPCSGRLSMPSVRMIHEAYGDLTFNELLPRLRCKQCRQPLAPVYLVAGHHRTFAYGDYGPPGCWAVELVSLPYVKPPRYVVS